jgi:glycosyltransferase involved in cell wall biosynthesis
MKLVIATPLYPPEIGGPSYYAKGLEYAFKAMGHEVVVVAYGNLRKLPTGLCHLAYFFRIFPKLKGADAVIALDTASVAIPTWLGAKMRGVPFIIRTGGDFVWEHYLERTHELVPLPFFYDEQRELSTKERLVYALTRFVVRRSTLVFSTEMQRNVWMHPYGLAKEKTRVVGNAVDAPLPSTKPTRKNFLWYVRGTAMKNGANLHAAFARAKKKFPDIEIEEGQLPKQELLERMKSCYAVLLPSVTEISPNYILDALRFKKPFIFDKYSGFAEWLSPHGGLVDPLDVGDIARAIEHLASDEGYREAVEKASRFSFVRTYDDVAKDFLPLIEQTV